MKDQTKQIIKHLFSVKTSRLNKSYHADLCGVFKVNKRLLSYGNIDNVKQAF